MSFLSPTEEQTLAPQPPSPAKQPVSTTTTTGDYLATRLEQIGLKHHFAVAGDYNLVLLDHLLLNKNMRLRFPPKKATRG